MHVLKKESIAIFDHENMYNAYPTVFSDVKWVRPNISSSLRKLQFNALLHTTNMADVQRKEPGVVVNIPDMLNFIYYNCN